MIIFGAATREDFGDEIVITVVATGLQDNSDDLFTPQLRRNNPTPVTPKYNKMLKISSQLKKLSQIALMILQQLAMMIWLFLLF